MLGAPRRFREGFWVWSRWWWWWWWGGESGAVGRGGLWAGLGRDGLCGFGSLLLLLTARYLGISLNLRAKVPSRFTLRYLSVAYAWREVAVRPLSPRIFIFIQATLLSILSSITILYTHFHRTNLSIRRHIIPTPSSPSPPHHHTTPHNALPPNNRLPHPPTPPPPLALHRTNKPHPTLRQTAQQTHLPPNRASRRRSHVLRAHAVSLDRSGHGQSCEDFVSEYRFVLYVFYTLCLPSSRHQKRERKRRRLISLITIITHLPHN